MMTNSMINLILWFTISTGVYANSFVLRLNDSDTFISEYMPGTNDIHQIYLATGGPLPLKNGRSYSAVLDISRPITEYLQENSLDPSLFGPVIKVNPVAVPRPAYHRFLATIEGSSRTIADYLSLLHGMGGKLTSCGGSDESILNVGHFNSAPSIQGLLLHICPFMGFNAENIEDRNMTYDLLLVVWQNDREDESVPAFIMDPRLSAHFAFINTSQRLHTEVEELPHEVAIEILQDQERNTDQNRRDLSQYQGSDHSTDDLHLTLSDMMNDVPTDENTDDTLHGNDHFQRLQERLMNGGLQEPNSEYLELQQSVNDPSPAIRLRSRLVRFRPTETCAICLSNLFGPAENGEEKSAVTVQGCGHSYHAQCLYDGIRYEALHGRLMRCPLCRQDLFDIVQ